MDISQFVPDIIISLLLILCFIIGWFRGLLRMLFGPISLIAGGVLAYFYYYQTHRFLWSVAIALAAPCIIHIILSLTYWIIRKILMRKKKDGTKKELPAFDQIAGAVFSTIWGTIILSILVVLFTIAPLPWPAFQLSQDYVKKSFTYEIINTLSLNKVERVGSNLRKFTANIQNPDQIKKLTESSSFQAIVSDEKIKSMIMDEKTLKQLQNRNIRQLTFNPNVRQAMNDPAVIKKIFKFEKDIMSGALLTE